MLAIAPTPTALTLEPLDLALLNNWQRDFPITPRPFDVIATSHGTTASDVKQRFKRLLKLGALSRIGGTFGVGAGGSAMLCALSVAPSQLDRIAQWVNSFDYVNHNYAREHHWNLWFVVTAPSVAERDGCIAQIESLTKHRALRLPMHRAFRIDLGFDLQTGRCQGNSHRRCSPIEDKDRALAAAIEEGLPVVDQPFEVWAHQAGCTESAAMKQVQTWLDARVLRRLGGIVRHHELGVNANAMTVFNVPDEQLQEHGQALARQPGVTLCYARHRDEGWSYNLYCMVHGRTETETRQHIEQARQQAKLVKFDHAVLFSTQRFKQIGGHYFRPAAQRMAVTA